MTEATVQAPSAAADAAQHPTHETAYYLQLGDIRPSPFNPRKRFDQAALEDLADKIAKQGVLQAIVVRQVEPAKEGGARYEIVAGERRWRACRILVERGHARPHVIAAFIRELDDFQAAEVALTENADREDLHPLEEAQAYENLLLHPVGGGDFSPPRLKGYTVEQLAEKIGHKPNYVFGRLKLLDLIQPAREAFLAGKLDAKTWERVARFPKAEQERAVPELLQGWGGEPFTHRQAMKHLRDRFMLKLSSAKFPIADADLVKKAGACQACPKRTGSNPGLFDSCEDDLCLDADCFKGKTEAHGARLVAKAEAEGKKVVTGGEAKKLLGSDHYSTEYQLRQKGYVDLDKPDETLTGTRKPLRKLLGDGFAESMVLQADGEALPVTVAKADDVKKALKAKGLLQPSQKSKPGEPIKKLTADDIKKQRGRRVDDLMMKRLPAAIVRHLEGDGAEGFPTDSKPWMLHLVSELYEASDLDFDELQRALTGSTDVGSRMWFETLDVEGLCRAAIVMMIGNEITRQLFASKPNFKQTDILAKEVGFDMPALRQSLGEEVDAQIRDEIQALQDAVAPAAKKTTAARKVAKPGATVKYRNPLTGETWSGRGLQPKWLKVALENGKTLADFALPTPASNASAQGTTSAAAKGKKDELTPEKALADAVAKEAGVDRAKLEAKPAKKSTSQKTKQKDETAKPPAAAKPVLSSEAAWPFPTSKGAQA